MWVGPESGTADKQLFSAVHNQGGDFSLRRRAQQAHQGECCVLLATAAPSLPQAS
jgi:hypothetical protein